MNHLAVFALLAMSLVSGQPVPASKEDGEVRSNGTSLIVSGEPATDRTIFLMISMTSMSVLWFLLGYKWKRLKRSVFINRTMMSTLVLIIFIVILVMITVSTVLIAGQALYNYPLCRAVAWTCLLGYSTTKFLIFFYLVERVHVIRAPYMTRRKDKLYLGCAAMVIIGFVPLLIKYYNPRSSMDENGRCRAGISFAAVFPTISVMFVVDLILTGVFFYLLWPVINMKYFPPASHTVSQRSSTGRSRYKNANETPAQRSIRILLWKSIIASILIEFPMLANFIQMAITKGEELGMICLAVCVVEVTWDALIIYWLSFGSSDDAERELERSTAGSSRVTNNHALSREASRKSSIEAGNIEAVPIAVLKPIT